MDCLVDWHWHRVEYCNQDTALIEFVRGAVRVLIWTVQAVLETVKAVREIVLSSVIEPCREETVPRAAVA